MIKRKLTPEEEARVASLRKRLPLTIRFIENVEEFPSGQQIRTLVEDAARRGDLRTLRLLQREVDAMSLALPSHEREGLEALLRERVGVDKEEERSEMRSKVLAILKRGAVASEKERRRLEEYAEMLEATGGDPSESSAIRRLLDAG